MVNTSREEQALVFSSLLGGPVYIGFSVQKGEVVHHTVSSASKALRTRIYKLLALHSMGEGRFEPTPTLAMIQRMKGGRQNKLDGAYLRLLDCDVVGFVNEEGNEVEDAPLHTVLAAHLLQDKISELQHSKVDSELPLKSWLHCRKTVDDAIGDFARDVEGEASFPVVGTFDDYIKFAVRVSKLPAVTRTVFDAWLECESEICSFDNQQGIYSVRRNTAQRRRR